ncbi:MAG: hypothetical protein C0518_12110 [Opitutus sp.]|nr:hypothetical protein [Opitutus sp.]
MGKWNEKTSRKSVLLTTDFFGYFRPKMGAIDDLLVVLLQLLKPAIWIVGIAASARLWRRSLRIGFRCAFRAKNSVGFGEPEDSFDGSPAAAAVWPHGR